MGQSPSKLKYNGVEALNIISLFSRISSHGSDFDIKIMNSHIMCRVGPSLRLPNTLVVIYALSPTPSKNRYIPTVYSNYMDIQVVVYVGLYDLDYLLKLNKRIFTIS